MQVLHDTVMKQFEIAELLENLRTSKHEVSFLLPFIFLNIHMLCFVAICQS